MSLTWDEVAEHAATLAGVREVLTRGRRRWQLQGRLVARQVDDTTIVIRCAFDLREKLLDRHPETFAVDQRQEGHMMVLADLARGDADAIREAMTSAWILQQDASR